MIVHRQKLRRPHPGELQQRAALGLNVRAHRVLAGIQQVNAGGHLARIGPQAGHRQALVVRRKGNADGRALTVGGVPAITVHKVRAVHLHFCGVTVGAGGHRQAAVLAHAAHQNGVVQRLCVEVLASAFHPQGVPGPVVHAEPAASHRKGGPGIAVLNGAQLQARGTGQHHILFAQFHKAACQLFHLIQLADAGFYRIAATGGQPDADAVAQVCQGRHRTAEHPSQRRNDHHGQKGKQGEHPALFALTAAAHLRKAHGPGLLQVLRRLIFRLW